MRTALLAITALLSLCACPSAPPTPKAKTSKAEPPKPAAARPPSKAPKRALRGDIRAASKADLEQLRGVTALAGDLFISGTDDISALSTLTTVEGTLTISMTKLTDLQGLQELRFVHGPLIITDNPSMTSLGGLEKLRSVASLHIEKNGALQNIEALGGLKEPGFMVEVLNNDALSSLKGLKHITGLKGTLDIGYNRALTDISALGALRTLGALRIEGNSKLTDLSGLANLKSVRNRLELRDVPACATKRLPSRLVTRPKEFDVRLEPRKGTSADCPAWPAQQAKRAAMPRPPRHVARSGATPKAYHKRWLHEAIWRQRLEHVCTGMAYKNKCASTREGIIRFRVHLDTSGGVRAFEPLENTVSQDPELVRACVEKAYKSARFAPPRGHKSSIELFARLATKC